MKICIVQSVIPLYAISFFNRIVELYPDVELVVLADLSAKDPLNQYKPELCHFKVRHLSSVLIAGVFLRPKILCVLAAVNADVTVFSASPREWSQLFAMMCGRVSGRKMAAWGMFHRVGVARPFTTFYFRMLGSIVNRCLTYSRVGASRIVSQGVPKSSVTVVGTAIDEKLPFLHSSALTEQILHDFKVKEGILGKKIVLQVVRLSRAKRPELLIQAMRQIAYVRDDVMAVLIGDGEMRLELECLVDSLGLNNSVRFLGSIYEEQALCLWYLSSQVFVVPTFLGLSGHHAMSYGLPVVTDDSLDHQGSEFEILADGLNGLTYQEGSAEDLASVLSRILSDVSLQYFLGANARKTIENTHNLDRKTKRFVQSLRELHNL